MALSRFSGMHLDITAARIAEDLNIFNTLDESNDAWSLATGSTADADSQILIEEMALPNAGVLFEAATIDLKMTTSLGASFNHSSFILF
ncbi:hypothetical protein F5Y06DRAFT_291577 [Hypoxylon sp. FL0890]|nr:hypothetical protein F5Y06DRAFT_291577 [Hypoxylon sp. FL0890]